MRQRDIEAMKNGGGETLAQTELKLNQQIREKSTRDIIAVDSREFSSMTPVYLYEEGFWIIPMQLTVGDYILSDEIAIERKSVKTGDLFESFKSGRLL